MRSKEESDILPIVDNFKAPPKELKSYQQLAEYQTLPLSALNTQALAKNPTPTVPKPQPATSLYLKTPIPMSINPIITMIKVAQPKTVFLFIIFMFRFFSGGYSKAKDTKSAVMRKSSPTFL
jgi:hypothetical protein